MPRDAIPRSRWGRLVLVVALLTGIGLRVGRFLENRPLWIDEAKLALSIGRRDFIGLLQPLDYNQVAPILYLWLLKGGASLLGMHEWTLRLPSLAAGVLVLWVVWLLGRRVLSEVGALVAVALAATAPMLVAYAAEAKPYELDACVSAILLLFALRVHERDDSGRRLTLGLAGVVGIGFSIPAVFILGGIGGALLLSAWRRRSWAAAASTAIWGVIWMCAFLLQRHLTYSDVATEAKMQSFWRGVMIRVGEPGWISRLGLSVRSGILGAMDPGWPVLRFLAPVAAGIGTLVIWKRSGIVAALMLALSLGLALLASALGLWPVDSRLALFLTPIAFLWFGALADLLWPASPHRTGIKVAVVGLVILGVALNITRPSRFPPLEASRDLIASLSPRRAMAPVYVFPGGVPTWVFYTTDWRHPDLARLDWYARVEPSRNVPSRGRAVMDGEPAVEWHGLNGIELVGRSTGMLFVMGPGWLTPGPDPNWGNAEMRRLAASGSAMAWVYGSHLQSAQVDSLRDGLERNGGEMVSEERGGSAVLWQVRFRPPSRESAAEPPARTRRP